MIDKKIPILFIVDCLYGDARGGSESQFRKLYDRSYDIGIDPHVVFLRHRKIHKKFKWTHKPETLNLSSIGSLQLRSALRRTENYITRHQIQIIQSLFDDASLFAYLLKRRNPTLQFVCTQRNLGHSRGRIKKIIFRLVYRLADRVLVNSAGITDVLTTDYRVKSDKIICIDNMHDIEGAQEKVSGHSGPRLKRTRKSLLGVVVANLRPIKGIGDLINACELLPKSSHIEFVVVGDGAERERYEKRVKKLGVSSRTRFIGYQDNVYPILAQADFAVLPSRAEGGSNSLIEYMLSGLPVIATNVGGNGDFLRGGRFGVLVNPKDSASLSSGLQELESNYAKWADAARDGREYARIRFSSHSIVSAYRTFYREIAMSIDNSKA